MDDTAVQRGGWQRTAALRALHTGACCLSSAYPSQTDMPPHCSPYTPCAHRPSVEAQCVRPGEPAPSRCAMSASDRSWTVFAAGASMGVVTAAASLAAARYLSSPRVLASDKVRLEPLYAARGWRDAGTQCGAWSGEAQPRCVMARVASPSFGQARQESGSRCSPWDGETSAHGTLAARCTSRFAAHLTCGVENRA